MRFAQSLIEISNEDCAVQAKGIRTWIWFSQLGLRSRGRQTVEEIWTCDLIQIWAILCVVGGDSTEYLWGVLYYVLLHVLYHYNIHIVGGFQLHAFPITCCVDMCDWCFNVRMWFFFIPKIDDQRRGGYVLCMHSANSV